MHTINANAVRGRSYEKFFTQKCIIRKFLYTKISRSAVVALHKTKLSTALNIDQFVPIFEPTLTSLKFIILWTNYHQQIEFGVLSECYHYQKTVSELFLAKALGMVLKLSRSVCRRFDCVTISNSYNKC